MPTIIVVDGQEFDSAMAALQAQLKDLRWVWSAIAQTFYAIEQDQFTSEGKHGGGTWQALSPKYGKYKAVKFPGRPIMVQSGRLKRSLTSMDPTDSIFQAAETTLDLGSKVEYAATHHYGRGAIPARPLIEITPTDEILFQQSWDKQFASQATQLGFSVQVI